MANKHVTDWLELDVVKFTDNVLQLHVDTRDFCVMSIQKPKSVDVSKIRKYAKRFFWTISEVEALIKRLYTESGGAGEWRSLALKHPDFDRDWWQLKYIRIFKTGLGYVVCNHHERALRKDLFDSPIDMEHLSFIPYEQDDTSV